MQQQIWGKVAVLNLDSSADPFWNWQWKSFENWSTFYFCQSFEDMVYYSVNFLLASSQKLSDSPSKWWNFD